MAQSYNLILEKRQEIFREFEAFHEIHTQLFAENTENNYICGIFTGGSDTHAQKLYYNEQTDNFNHGNDGRHQLCGRRVAGFCRQVQG